MSSRGLRGHHSLLRSCGESSRPLLCWRLFSWFLPSRSSGNTAMTISMPLSHCSCACRVLFQPGFWCFESVVFRCSRHDFETVWNPCFSDLSCEIEGSAWTGVSVRLRVLGVVLAGVVPHTSFVDLGLRDVFLCFSVFVGESPISIMVVMVTARASVLIVVVPPPRFCGL